MKNSDRRKTTEQTEQTEQTKRRQKAKKAGEGGVLKLLDREMLTPPPRTDSI